MGVDIRQAFVGAGANLGDRAATLRAAIARLRSTAGITWLESSSWYETMPVGVTDQPDFLNLVLGLETTLSPEALLAELQAVENAFGRVRSVRWGPRTLDLDVLAFAGETRDTATLQLPHPRLFERAFVLVPLQELLRHDRFSGAHWNSLRAQAAAATIDQSGVRRWALPGV